MIARTAVPTWPLRAAKVMACAALPRLEIRRHRPLPGDADDTVLMQGMGAPTAQVHLAVRHQELARHAAAEDKAQWERREYCKRY